jgi:hypothetical protein
VTTYRWHRCPSRPFRVRSIETRFGYAPTRVAEKKETDKMSDSNPSPNGDWTPVVALDVMTATQKTFDEKHREFYRVTRD